MDLSRVRGSPRARGAVLGIWDGHGASVSLVADGQLRFALAEERPARRKRFSGFPRLALRCALEWARQKEIPITDVALAGRTGRAPLRLAQALYARGDPHRDPLSLLSRAALDWECRWARLPGLDRLDALLGSALLRRRLVAAAGTGLRFHLVDHHEAHAFSALLGRHGMDALVITADAYGEGRAATLRQAAVPLRCEREQGIDFGLALLYGAVTVGLGFREGDEGKLMGLSAAGSPDLAEGRFLDLFLVDGGAPRLRRPLTRRRVAALLRGLSREDVAAGLQACTERLALRWLRGLLARFSEPRPLLLAGGLFANIQLNRRLAELPAVCGLQVFPEMGDGGLSAGAAHRVAFARDGEKARALEHAYLGLAFDEDRCLQAARRSGLAQRRTDPARAAVRQLARGRVICRFAGRDEYGPRALGHRSILFSAARRELPQRVNRALAREPFMAFAPCLRQEDASQAIEPLDAELAYMNVAVRARAGFAKDCPTAVHIDGSCRPQLVRRETSPGLWTLLGAFQRQCGEAAVINTSFNLHGEPIVHTPEDAVASFRKAGFDVLYVGDLELLGAHLGRG